MRERLFIMCRGKRLRERVLALLLVYSFFCVSIFPADAQAALRVTDMLSPRVNINIDNFYFDFRSKIILSEPGVTREFAQTLEQIKDHTAWQEDLEAIKRYYEASISEGVESNTNRMLWNLKKANDLCAKWIKAEEILRSSGFKSDSNFLKTISDYAQKIEAIKTGQTEECRKFWNIQRIDPKNGENVPAGYILKEDLSAIVPFLSPGLIWNDLEKLGLINENGKIDSNMLASVHNAGELKISAKEAEREKVLGELRDRMQGKPVSFRQAHEEGRWHANVQVLILDAEGNVLVEPRSDRGGVEIGGEIIQFGPIITTELAVTGHLKQGEDYPSAACRIIRDRLGISLSAEQLCRLPKLPYGQKKAGTSKYNQENIEYDEQGMHFLSRDAFNYEFAGAFIYILNDQQRAALKPKPDGRPKIEFMPLHSILEWHQNNEKIAAPFYRSAFMLTFNHPDNFNPILGETHGILIKILERANKDPENIDYDVDAIAKLAESVISLQRKLDDASVPKKDEDKPAQREAQAFRELKSLANSARVLYRWKKIKQLLASMDREHFHKLKETRMFFDEVKDLGIGEKDKIARALIYLLAKKDVKLVVAEQGFVFQHNGIDLKGMRVDDNGKFQIINKRLIAGVKEIQRGAIASDMDLVLAMRDKNIDREILKFFNQLRLSGFVLAVISANEFRKQHGRSLAELIHENLLDDFYIYANGAGVKAKWDQGKIGTTTWGGEIKGSFVDDKDYGGTFSEQQLDFFDTRIHPVLKVWEK
ncbi:MAG: hypothetical protein PHO30_04700, partial [Candidatus Omnitrophica bacterium]|nr:hypothetical protein [Candidatus Omnitrophota bacterium]